MSASDVKEQWLPVPARLIVALNEAPTLRGRVWATAYLVVWLLVFWRTLTGREVTVRDLGERSGCPNHDRIRDARKDAATWLCLWQKPAEKQEPAEKQADDSPPPPTPEEDSSPSRTVFAQNPHKNRTPLAQEYSDTDGAIGEPSHTARTPLAQPSHDRARLPLQSTNTFSTEGGGGARAREDRPPPPPPPLEDRDDLSDEPLPGSVAAVREGWRRGWLAVWPHGEPYTQGADSKKAKLITQRFPGLDADGYAALAESYLRAWDRERKWPVDSPSISTWRATGQPPSLKLAPPPPPEPDYDPLAYTVASEPAPVARPAWVDAAEDAWWPTVARKGPPPPPELIAWWADNAPLTLQIAERELGYPLLSSAEARHA